MYLYDEFLMTILNEINMMSCPIKNNSNKIELTVQTFCYWVLDLLCVKINRVNSYFVDCSWYERFLHETICSTLRFWSVCQLLPSLFHFFMRKARSETKQVVKFFINFFDPTPLFHHARVANFLVFLLCSLVVSA